jgi:hypothetical protein
MNCKTLIGKNGYLFLINDSCKELEVHCNNLNLVNNEDLTKYTFDNFLLIVIPNKSLIYKDYLPDNYDIKYRPALEIYKNKLKEKLLDCYKYLKNEENTYYKTDTHINFKGNYIIYSKFIKKINKLYNLNLIPKKINIDHKICKLNQLNYGIGDLTWPSNLGNQQLDDINDVFYYSNDIIEFYNIYKIKNNKEIRFLTYKLEDMTNQLENETEFAHWNIISKYIIYKKNNHIKNKKKVLIFYDSFLLNAIPLYIDLFYEVYMIKTIYNNNLIKLINPDFVFEFRVERFLC